MEPWDRRAEAVPVTLIMQLTLGGAGFPRQGAKWLAAFAWGWPQSGTALYTGTCFSKIVSSITQQPALNTTLPGKVAGCTLNARDQIWDFVWLRACSTAEPHLPTRLPNSLQSKFTSGCYRRAHLGQLVSCSRGHLCSERFMLQGSAL